MVGFKIPSKLLQEESASVAGNEKKTKKDDLLTRAIERKISMMISLL